MKPHDRAWQNLVAVARQAQDDRDTAAPYGFATRVAALAMTAPSRPLVSLYERFSWRALGLAGLLAVSSVVTNFAVSGSVAEEDVLSDDGAVASLFGVS